MKKIESGSIHKLLVTNIQKNKDNPRLLFDMVSMNELQRSIKLRGVLVPVIVYKHKQYDDKYVLLDGERRYNCVKNLKIDTVPAYIFDTPDRTENLLQMFNIHNKRQPWELVPTALSIEKLINLLEKNNEKTTNTELAKLTGMTAIRISDCKRILKYKEYHYLALEKDLKKRIGGDFFSQMDMTIDKMKKNPKIMAKFTKKQLIKIFIDKKIEGNIVGVAVDFKFLRSILASHKKGIPEDKINDSVFSFLNSEPNSSNTIRNIYEILISHLDDEKNILSISEKLIAILDQFNYDKIKNKKNLNKTLSNLKRSISDIVEP